MTAPVVTLDHNVLVLENGRILQEFVWNQGHLITRSLRDVAAGHVWENADLKPDLQLPGEQPVCGDGALTVGEARVAPRFPLHRQAIVESRLGALEIRRVFRLYEGTSAVACDLFFRGRPAAERWRTDRLTAGDARAIEAEQLLRADQLPMPQLAQAPLHDRHIQARCIQFFDVTDRRNTLTRVDAFVPYKVSSAHIGNLLLVWDVVTGAGLFILKEAPCSDSQLAYPGCDFVCDRAFARLIGTGLDPQDLDAKAWTRAYGFVMGVAAGGEETLLTALRSYQEQTQTIGTEVAPTVMLNTWGDRGEGARLDEAFVLKELEAGARLGATHLMLDYGWQKGRRTDTVAGLSFANLWQTPDFWTVHPEKFPCGLRPLVDRACSLGLEIGLWFNPCPDNGHAHWQKDADALIALYREYGIRYFKIDGMDLPDQASDRNMRRMLERIAQACDHQAIFNLDITAGQRVGYHYFGEYGNVFVENRYTDWGNYYPHWTLRNLWRLARFVPPQKLQVEWLNGWRNRDRYPADDPLSPGRVPFDYCFAITWMAQPLAWFEVSNLPAEAFALRELMRRYLDHQQRIHAGQIFPIGEEPSGSAWTGFQSVRGERGYLLVYREWNDRDQAALKLWTLPGQRLFCQLIAGQGQSFVGAPDTDGRMAFTLPRPLTFALYAYQVENESRAFPLSSHERPPHAE